MRSSFYGLNMGLSGLYAAQSGLAVTSNNISNAATTGYSRQVVNQRASSALPGAGRGMYGTGVETTGITSIRDSYLDVKMWGQNDTLGEYRVKTSQNMLLESVFGEPSDAGFTKIYSDFFNALDDISKLPSETERAEALKQTMMSFTQYFNSTSTALESFRKDLNFELKTVVDEINLLTSKIESLNKQIYEAEIYGDTANALRDERAVAVDRLSQLINVEAEEVERVDANGNVHKEFVVKANGYILVDHMHAQRLELESDPNNNGFYKIMIGGKEFDMSDSNLSGELKGIIDMRDGGGTNSANGVTYNGIPYYMDRLDEFVITFADEMNRIYGRDINGEDSDPPMCYLFRYDPENPAQSFRIDDLILEDANNIRTSYGYLPPDENPEPDNNDLLLDLLNVKDEPMFGSGTASDYMIAMFSQLGINTQEAVMYYESQVTITNTIELQRLSVSQVDTNEEFMNLIKYNQAYQAAARIITTMDEIYNTTINRIGSW